MPLVTGERLMAALRSGEVRFGVYAYSTAAGGLVAENAAVFRDLARELDRHEVHISHALFAREHLAPEQVTLVASHPEALRECRETLNRVYPTAQAHPMNNTATAANALAEGELPEGAAVLCAEELGQSLHLTLLRERTEDRERNTTVFVLVELKE